MSPPSRDSDPDPKPVSNNSNNANANVVFLDTNLDTHLAVIVSDHDTVSDLKKRILSEHPLCFPKLGQIQIHAMKVKRKGYFYHLSDSMFVKSAFYGFNKSWFLSVDASPLGEHGQTELLRSSGSPNRLACLGNANKALIGPVDIAINNEKEECEFVNPSGSKQTRKEAGKKLETGVNCSGDNDIGVPMPSSIPDTQDHCYVSHEPPSLQIECEVDGSRKGVKDDRNVCEEISSVSVPCAKKRRKSKKRKEDTVEDNASKEKIASDDHLLSFASKEVSLSNSQVPQLENKQGEENEIPFVGPYVSEDTGKELVKNLETDVKYFGNNEPGSTLPGSIPETQYHCCVNHEPLSLQIECEVDGSRKGVKDDRNVCEEISSISVPSAKKRRKSKTKKEDTVEDNTSKEKIASDDNLLSFTSKEVSLNNIQVPQRENKQNEENEIPFVSPYLSEDTGKELVKNLEVGVKSFGNNEPGIPLPGSILETEDHCCVNHELPSSHVVFEVDGISKSVPSSMKKKKSKRKKEDIVQYDISKENDASVFEPVNDIFQRDIAVIANPKEVIKETEVLKENQPTECKKNDMKNDIDTESMKEALEPAHATNKKHGKRKRSLTHDSEEMLKEETVCQKLEAQKSDEACKEPKESKDQFEFDNDTYRDDVEYKHDKETEGVSDIKPSAKKKQKGKGKSGDKSLSKKKLSVISNFNVDNVSHQLLEVQQKIKNSSADQSAEHLNDTDPVRTSEHGGRRKGKKKSSNSHETHVTSSRKDDEADHFSIRGEGVQEDISEDGLIPKDISMSKTTLEKMEIGTDASTEGIPSKVKKTGNCKNYCGIEIKVHPSDVKEPKEPTEDNVNIVLDQCHKSEVGLTEGAEGGREVLPQNDPKPMLLEECTPSNQINTDANINELNVASKVVDMNGMGEPVKSEKKKKKKRTRKAKDSDGGTTLGEGIGPIDASESETVIVKSLKSTNCDPASGNTGAEENPLSHTERKNVQQEEMKGTVLSATDMEDDFRVDNTGSLEQIETKANTEHVDKKHRKKPNNKQSSTSKSLSNMPTKDEVFDSKRPSQSSDSGTHASPSSKITKKNKLASPKSTNESSKTNLEPVKYSVGLEPSDSQFVSGSNRSSQFPSNTPKGIDNLCPVEANDAAKDSGRSYGEKDDCNLEAPLKNYKNNAEQQFPSQQLQHKANMTGDILVDKMNGSDRKDLDPMTGQNACRREETKVHTHAENLSSSQQLSSKKEHISHPDKKVPNFHKTKRYAKLSSRSKNDVSSIRENRKLQVNATGKSMYLVNRREGIPMSNSMMKGLKKMVQRKAREASGNNVGGVLHKIQQKKSLLAGAIFKDDSSGTSEDVDEVDKSDASTRTPSENSLLSDFSDGDSSAGQELQQNGSYGGKRLENGERSALKGSNASTKGMPIDRILRSSSRYKKAKITASQLEGSESQPDFVPDSLADM